MDQQDPRQILLKYLTERIMNLPENAVLDIKDEIGIDSRIGKNYWMERRANNTATIVITINGGKKDQDYMPEYVTGESWVR